LTFDLKRATLKTMKRAAKTLAAVVLVLFFTSGIWCASLTAPSLSIASVTDCSQRGGPMEMGGCDHPYLCGFDSSSISRAILTTARPNNLSKNAHDLSIGECPINAIKEGAPIGNYTEDSVLIHGPGKVSIRLFNSIFNL